MPLKALIVKLLGNFQVLGNRFHMAGVFKRAGSARFMKLKENRSATFKTLTPRRAPRVR
jgi:hypothetical protein